MNIQYTNLSQIQEYFNTLPKALKQKFKELILNKDEDVTKKFLLSCYGVGEKTATVVVFWRKKIFKFDSNYDLDLSYGTIRSIRYHKDTPFNMVTLEISQMNTILNTFLKQYMFTDGGSLGVFDILRARMNSIIEFYDGIEDGTTKETAKKFIQEYVSLL